MSAAESNSSNNIRRQILSDLNAEQSAAAESIDRPTLVVSPAGTGKTRVLAARYQLMLASGTAINRLLAITFSNRATQEMRDRIGSVLDGVDERDIFINTFHALGKRILRSIPKRFGLTEQFRIADENETHQIIRECVMRVDRESLEGPFGQDRITRMAELIDQIKNAGMTASTIAASDRRFKNRTLMPADVEIIEEYESQMRHDNIVDYNDLILKPLLAFDQDPALAESWRRQFDGIMIDEYQDTNQMQYRLLRHLTEGKDNLLFLGDDDQLIFQWRGADNSYVIDFEEQWPNGQVLSLRINYRNAPQILESAKKMIGRNENRRSKDMVASRSNEAVLEMRTFDDQSQEQDYIARLIKSFIEKGTPLDEIAVLTRNRAEATSIALSLAAHEIPCYSPDHDILGQREVRALISWARIAINETDRLSLMNAMSTPEFGITASASDKLNEWARDNDKNLIDVVRETVSSGRAAVDGPLDSFLKTFQKVLQIDLTDKRAFEEIATVAGLFDFAEKQSPAAVQTLNQAITIFTSTYDELDTIGEVLDAISISFRSTIEARQGQSRVRVDTMHSSKGLEFDVVIVSGWEEGHFPRNSRSLNELEESRRLAYVTVSRARNAFIATVVRRRPNGARPPSRFLSEIGIMPDVVAM